MTRRLLLAAHDARQEGVLSRLFLTGDEFRITRAAAPNALEPAELAQFDCVVLAGAAWGVDPAVLLRTLRAETATRDIPVIVFEGDPRLVREAWIAGADAVFPLGADADVVLGRAKVLVAAWERRKTEATQIRDGEENLRLLSDLVLELADAAAPGLRIRGEEVAWVAGQLSGRFEIPPQFCDDLFIAARLHGVGRCLLHDLAGGLEPWRWAAATAGELRSIPGLKNAAELIGSSTEHWDGSGQPGGLQRGQIPLRSRIIRFAVDLVDASLRISNNHDTKGLVAAVTALTPYSGTLYDPAVVSAAEVLFKADQPNTREVRRVQVGALEPGMRLAEDLVTASGVKLLAAEAVLTSASVGLITRRHVSDPIIHAVRIWIPTR